MLIIYRNCLRFREALLLLILGFRLNLFCLVFYLSIMLRVFGSASWWSMRDYSYLGGRVFRMSAQFMVFIFVDFSLNCLRRISFLSKYAALLVCLDGICLVFFLLILFLAFLIIIDTSNFNILTSCHSLCDFTAMRFDDIHFALRQFLFQPDVLLLKFQKVNEADFSLCS